MIRYGGSQITWYYVWINNININIFLSLENPCIHLFVYEGKDLKHIFNTNSELSQNHTEKQIIPPKQQ